MVNPRFSKAITELRGKEFFQTAKRIGRMRPDGMQIPPAVLKGDPSTRKADKDLPFVAGDRVQICTGPDKGKVGWVLDRYPGLGNAFYVMGVGSEKSINPVETKRPDQDDNGGWEPIVNNYKVFDYEDMRLVSKIKDEKGRNVDVVIHSVELGPEQYNEFSNTHQRIRFAKHDRTIQIPYPMLEKPKPVPEERAQLTTSPAVADARTHYVMSAVECPLPLGMVDQITNLNSKYKRSRYAHRLTAEEIARAQPPSMPVPPRTRKLLAELEKLPKPAKAEWTPEVAQFLDSELQKGLQKRANSEKNALESYQ